MKSDPARVTIHYAQTLDGRIATRSGHSQWIGGEASLRLAHELRAGHAAVMVGVGTVLADNPRLTTRLVAGPSPARVVVDSRLRLPLQAAVLQDNAAPTIIATTRAAPADRRGAIAALGARIVDVEPDENGRVDLASLVDRLAVEGLTSVLIEGGAGLITSALRQGIAERVLVCIAPKVVGAGIEAVGPLEIDRLSDALTFQEARFTPLGDDLIFEGRLAPRTRAGAA
ncbi:MAG TPA: RibD family protein [Chloroflexota bacterium]|nr:RibD family protein [Chloroflexota bacterium]